MNKTYIAGAVSGFIGGIIGAYVLGNTGLRLLPQASAVAQDAVSASRIRLLDSTGHARAELALSPDGGPGLFFYDSHGRNRLVLGLYSPAESEYPFVVLNDTRQAAAGIFRLFGPQETPVVVLKNKGADRSILGLNPNSTDPFLVNYSAERKKTEIFGSF
ncbi:MAG TPA: hypothetical protein VNW26_08010 [Steroidobacteraceae bacterium]|jgi:hypothetical protein|nr:hypothetical protein [Steroidobacteraceae bacterium]